MLKKIFTLTCFTFIFSLSAFCYSEDNLSALEYAKYGENYPYESLGERLNRLETDYFGMAQTGGIEERLDNIYRINSKAKNGVNLPDSGIFYNDKPKSVLRSFWEDLTSGFSDNGYVTGYTPSMMNTVTTSGYSNNLNSNNFGYNPYSFCPYDNFSHYRSPVNRHRYFDNSNFNGVNRIIPRNRHRSNRFNHHRYRNTGNNLPYTTTTSYYLPPNVQTQSSVHILKD